MNFAKEEALKLIRKYPDKNEFVIASGVSPSGFIHIGNFREIVTTYFVGKELENLGKKVNFILSFDDFDRFRKVPKGIPDSYNKYIGMPYTSIPSPFSPNKSYAKEMEDRFLEELNRLGINPFCIYQTDEYQSGRYNDGIKLALDERKKIFDIQTNFKTQSFTEEDRNNFYPISLYCENCNKDTTNILNYNELTGDIEYKCKCGNHSIENVNDAKNIKLQWKVDWAMRWKKEQVVFEPGGRDHSAENGSFAVSKIISNEIFNYEAPSYIAYDFIGIKGANGKMASSTGNVLTLTDLLNVYDKYLILWFYAKNKPSHQFNIALDEDVIRYYTEFDRLVKAYFEGKLDANNSSILSLVGVTKNYINNPDFGTIANFLPMVNYNINYLINLLSKENIDCYTDQFKGRLLRATNWLNKYGNSKYNIRELFNEEYYNTLTDEEKGWIEQTYIILQENYDTTHDLQEELYAIVKNKNEIEDQNQVKIKQRKYFEIIYNMILGENKGPKMGLLLFALDKDIINNLLCYKNVLIKK